MGNAQKLLQKAKESPANFKFRDLCKLAEHAGFVLRHVKGSHHQFTLNSPKRLLSLQPDKKDKSKAKPYQVSQLVGIIDEQGLIKS